MRGPMTGPSGEIIEMPVISNFREGLDIMEYFISTHGGRKGAADTALKTADSGYLTRRLVDASSDTIIRITDCGTTQGVEINPFRFSKTEIMESIEDRIYGRVTSRPIADPSTGEVIVEANQWITREMAAQIGKMEVDLPIGSKKKQERLVGTVSVEDVRDPNSGRVIIQMDEIITPRLIAALRAAKISRAKVRPQIMIRSPMVCEVSNGICQYCYGLDMSNHRPVELGTAVGVIAAQSVGEPGTQLTMRTFHTGGVAGVDITQGLPRAEELFEARKTVKSAQAEISPLDGHVSAITFGTSGNQVEITGERRSAQIPSPLECATVGEEVDITDLIDAKSPCTGEVYLLSNGEPREMLVIDTASGDRSYLLPPGAVPQVRDGTTVAAGEALTERFNIQPIVADRRGTLRFPEGKERSFQIVGRDESIQTYEIPYGARMMVEPGATVKEGDHLTSKSKPIVIAAEAEGRVLLLPERILVYNPQGRALRFRLTPDVVPLKGNGEPVRESEKLVKLEIPQTTILVEDIEDKDGIAIVHFHPKSTVEINQAATVRTGDKVKEGDLLTKGVVAPHTLLEAAGVQKAREYLLSEIHKVYKAQGVDINDKHLEVIIREILNNVRIVDRGDSRFLLSDLVSLEEFQDEVRRLMRWNQEAEQTCSEAIGGKIAEDIVAQGRLLAAADDSLTEDVMAAAQRANLSLIRVQRGEEAVEIPLEKKRLPIGERELLRISKAALQTKGWLSAASFQRTTKVLAEAALRGEIDELDGLKPSIIVGKKIPAGTGFPNIPEVLLSEPGEHSEQDPEQA